MRKETRIAFIGNSLPRRCGIATFTTDLQQAVAASSNIETSIVAMTDRGGSYAYPAAVNFEIRDSCIEDYERAADFLNKGGFDAISLQHEFGIFGGEAGRYIVNLLSRLTVPVVTTLHTVLAKPTLAQRLVMERIIDLSSKVIVMAEKGRDMLCDIYRVPVEKIEVIPHGIPDFPFVEPDDAKSELGYDGRTVILTFGLLAPSKGIEVMIDAMPSILESCDNAVYVVLGATHPNLIRDQGEAYREGLAARVQKLGIEEHVVFLDQFVDLPMLLGFISMCDIYVTPYLNEAQLTSGTLSYSYGLGKAVVSTPYWHAQELLAGGAGVLVPFGDASTIGDEISILLTNRPRLRAMRERAYRDSRSMTWARVAERYRIAFENARLTYKNNTEPHGLKISSDRSSLPSNMRIDHFLSMCDDTGLFQHAVHSVPDRSHGYCVDDNARALILACALNKPGEQRLSESLITKLAAFVQDAWNPKTKRFRNFMSFDRRWLEDEGSEDSQGRTLWALGECTKGDTSESRQRWAASLFREALSSAENFRSPRAWAFALLGLDAYCAVSPRDPAVDHMRSLLAGRLLSVMVSVETKDWIWFEEGLAYDNARLPQALILTGISMECQPYIDAGLRSLDWLVSKQTAAGGFFRPVGTESFGDQRLPPRLFDQQPLEATATISACLAAWRADGDERWKSRAMDAFEWFLGRNDLCSPLVDHETGSCRDGLHPDRPNENRGGESVVSYLLSLSEMRQIARQDVRARGHATLDKYPDFPVTTSKSRGRFAGNQIPEQTGSLFAPRPGESGRSTIQTCD